MVHLSSWHGLTTITKYIPTRSEATPEALKAAYENMITRQQQENELSANLLHRQPIAPAPGLVVGVDHHIVKTRSRQSEGQLRIQVGF